MTNVSLLFFTSHAFQPDVCSSLMWEIVSRILHNYPAEFCLRNLSNAIGYINAKAWKAETQGDKYLFSDGISSMAVVQ